IPGVEAPCGTGCLGVVLRDVGASAVDGEISSVRGIEGGVGYTETTRVIGIQHQGTAGRGNAVAAVHAGTGGERSDRASEESVPLDLLAPPQARARTSRECRQISGSRSRPFWGHSAS